MGETTTDPAPGETLPGDTELIETSRTVLEAVIRDMGGAVREGQSTMVDNIAHTIGDENRLMVQAGTGTGKSIGYLVPALTHSALTNERVLISTATLALQRQIIAKDAPSVAKVVHEVTGVEPSVALFKGWNNYLCLYRLAGGYPDEGTLFDPAYSDNVETSKDATALSAQILELRKWAQHTTSGDRDDLVPGPSERAWRHVSVSKRECLGKSCPMVDECFAQLARDEAAEADVIVTNHTLVGINATGEADLFGDVDVVIIDEAHELAERVRSQAQVSVSPGMLSRIARRVKSSVQVDSSELEQQSEALALVLQECEEGLIRERPDALAIVMRAIDIAVRDLHSQVTDSAMDAASKLLARGAVEEVIAVTAAWNNDAEQSITWISEVDTGQTSYRELVIAPLDVASAIGNRALGDKGAVLTSATLALGGKFDSIAFECGLGLSAIPWRGIDVGTPFDEARQGIMYIARHLPSPSMGVSDEVINEVVELCEAAGGGALVLFSSWKGALAGAQALRERTSLRVFAQGEEATSSLIEQFRDDVDSCLVGTLGLWQGVDVPGDSCRLVIMDRIPFPHPEDPVSQALNEHASRQRRSGFWTVSVPRSALLMAQGAGRLLRTVKDRGVVAILDSRLLTKSYGSFIRAALPKMWPTVDPKLVRSSLYRLKSADYSSSEGVEKENES